MIDILFIAAGSSAGVGVGVTFLVLLLIAGAIGGVWFFRKKHFGMKPPGAVAFENPSYIREPSADPAALVSHSKKNKLYQC